jgi:hypothetical protein
VPLTLVRDNGFNAGIDYKPVGYIDLEFDFSRSVPLQLNSYSFGIGFDLTWLLHPHRPLTFPLAISERSETYLP